jgi:hypothetical protein
MMTFKDFFLTENLYKNTGWVYHRTKVNPETTSIHKNGIDTYYNSRAMYGQGLYTCYDFSQQLKPKMKSEYGDFILKGKIDLSGFIILDKNVFEKVNPHKNYTEYMKTLGFNELPENDYEDKIIYTSGYAQYLVNNIKNITQKNNGILFVGKHDGKVAVIWNKNNFIPYSYSKDDGKTWIKLDFYIKGIKTNNNYTYAKKRKPKKSIFIKVDKNNLVDIDKDDKTWTEYNPENHQIVHFKRILKNPIEIWYNKNNKKIREINSDWDTTWTYNDDVVIHTKTINIGDPKRFEETWYNDMGDVTRKLSEDADIIYKHNKRGDIIYKIFKYFDKHEKSYEQWYNDDGEIISTKII